MSGERVVEYSSDGYTLTKQGVRDLNKLVDKSKIRPTRLVSRQPLMEHELSPSMGMDLIYADDGEIRELITKNFPEAELEPDYDCIHGRRLGVKAKCSEKEWLTFVLREGLGTISLICQMRMIDNPRIIGSLLDEIDPEWRTRKK